MQSQIRDIEAVHRRATKQVLRLKDLSYEGRLQKLNLPTLKFRRFRGDKIETFKTMHNIYDPQAAPSLPRARKTHTCSLRGHSLKIEKKNG